LKQKPSIKLGKLRVGPPFIFRGFSGNFNWDF